jgi:hypothetical protein
MRSSRSVIFLFFGTKAHKTFHSLIPIEFYSDSLKKLYIMYISIYTSQKYFPSSIYHLSFSCMVSARKVPKEEGETRMNKR